jgi:exodeoxyribonuclease VII large subunit
VDLFEAAAARKAEATRSVAEGGEAAGRRQAREQREELPAAGAQADPGDGPAILTVAALTAQIKRVLEGSFPDVWVVGEVSNLTNARSGHVYLTLKDGAAEINAVIWRGVAGRIRFDLADGQEIVAHGTVAVYERRGRYQIIIKSLRPKGIGALQLAFQQLKEKLEAEGLFAPDRKRPLPLLPRTIGIVTSATGAAIHDMLTMILARMPNAHVLLHPVAVQGDAAAPQIAGAIRDLNLRGGIDVLIIGRGGGSLEDLWPFNEEIVARAVAASQIPVISAVGHEVDVSISDLVADRRALTPTNAGEIVVPSRDQLHERLDNAARRLGRSLFAAVERGRARLDGIARSYALRAPMERIRQHHQRLDETERRSERAARIDLARRRERLDALGQRLESLGPTNVLRRGYSITTRTGDGGLVSSPDDAPAGTKLRTLLRDGELHSTVSG